MATLAKTKKRASKAKLASGGVLQRRSSPTTSVRPSVAAERGVRPANAPEERTARAYAKAVDFLLQQTDYERMRIVRYNTTTFNLERMRLLLKHLGNPHLEFKSIHVAGTKGKGSTCHMVSAMLTGAGLKTGLYTSPHLLDMRERIAINEQIISQADFAALVKRIEPVVRKLAMDPPTFFELMTAMAFMHFAEQNVDIAVVETGLGGRLDSTNVIDPEVTAITNISYDHMAVLGNSLGKIAEEKAGIFKKDVPALSVLQAPEAQASLERVARAVKAPLEFVGADIEFSYRFELARVAGPHTRVSLQTPLTRHEHLTVPLMGEHQAVNCGLALAILDKLKARGLKFDDVKAVEGLKQVCVPGRTEWISTQPRVMIDGAHNAASLQALFKAISQHVSYDSMVVIFGCNCDKDVSGMLEQVSLGADKVIFTRSSNNPKSASPDELSNVYTDRFGKMAQVASCFTEALSIATRAISREDVIVVTGSFYLIGEAKRYFMGRAGV